MVQEMYLVLLAYMFSIRENTENNAEGRVKAILVPLHLLFRGLISYVLTGLVVLVLRFKDFTHFVQEDPNSMHTIYAFIACVGVY